MGKKITYAFPTGDHNNFDGMTLRDWFAGQALAGIMDLVALNTDESISPHLASKRYATRAYTIADAMMIERNK